MSVDKHSLLAASPEGLGTAPSQAKRIFVKTHSVSRQWVIQKVMDELPCLVTKSEEANMISQ